MNAVDIAIIVVSFVSAIMGLRQGIVRTVLTMAGLVIGVVLAGHYYGRLADVISPSGADWAKVVAYAIIVVGAVLAASVIGKVISGIVSAMFMGWLDKLLGAVLGLVMGGTFCAAIIIIVSKYVPGVGEAVSQSRLAPLLMQGIPLLLALLPGEFDFIQGFFTQPPRG